MTIIAAASWGGETWIGCDQAGTDGNGVQINYGSKVLQYGWGAVGFAASYRLLQAMEKPLGELRGSNGASGIRGLVCRLSEVLKEIGWSQSLERGIPECEDVAMLVAKNSGELFTVHSDLSWLSCENYAAIGSGDQLALGALHLSYAAYDPGVSVEEGYVGTCGAVVSAVNAACDLISTCAHPAEPVRVR